MSESFIKGKTGLVSCILLPCISSRQQCLPKALFIRDDLDYDLEKERKNG